MQSIVIITGQPGIPVEDIGDSVVKCFDVHQAFDVHEFETALCDQIVEGSFFDTDHHDIQLLLVVPRIHVAATLAGYLDNLGVLFHLVHFSGSRYFRYRWQLAKLNEEILGFVMSEQDKILLDILEARVDVTVEIDKNHKSQEALILPTVDMLFKAFAKCNIHSSKART